MSSNIYSGYRFGFYGKNTLDKLHKVGRFLLNRAAAQYRGKFEIKKKKLTKVEKKLTKLRSI